MLIWKFEAKFNCLNNMQFYLVQRSLEYSILPCATLLRVFEYWFSLQYCGNRYQNHGLFNKIYFKFFRESGHCRLCWYEILRQELIVSRITLLRVFEKCARPAVYPQCEDTSLHFLKKKYLVNNKKIWKNWAISKNFDICFCVILDFYCRKFVFGGTTGHEALPPPNFEVFLILSNFLKS